MSSPLASIVLPAHNEAAVLERCLGALLDGSAPGELDVVVVANACTDRTADIAREVGVRVVETSTPGKAHALRLGDAECVAFPRIYADADIELTYASVRALISALADTDALAVAPVPRWDLRGASGPVSRVHRVHDRLMSTRRGLAGVGVYALSEAGHRRVFPLPDVLSDDGFVHRSFAADERRVVPGASVVIRPARTLRAHLQRRLRVRQGGRELDSLGVPLRPEERIRLRSLIRLVSDGSVTFVDGVCYLGVTVVDRSLIRLRGGSMVWSTDTTSRTAA